RHHLDTRNVGPSRSPFPTTLDRGSSSPGGMGGHPDDLRIPTNRLGVEDQGDEVGISHLGQVGEERPRDRGAAAGQRSASDARNEIYEQTVSCSHYQPFGIFRNGRYLGSRWTRLASSTLL